MLPIALVAIGALCAYKLVIYPLFLSPLRTIPRAHWSSAFNPFWILYLRWAGRETRTIHEKHQQLGPVLLLGPNDISVNSVEGGLRTIYAGGWEKSTWYESFMYFNGTPNMFSTVASKAHSIRKRRLSGLYSKASIQASTTLRSATAAILHNRLLPLIASLTAPTSTPSHAGDHPSSPSAIDIFPLLSAVAMDVVSANIFGLANGTNLVQDPAARHRSQDWLVYQRQPSFWVLEMPGLTHWLRTWLGVNLVPSGAREANRNFERMVLDMCAKAERSCAAGSTDLDAEQRQEDFPAVYAELTGAVLREASSKETVADAADTKPASLSAEDKLLVASELMDNILGGWDATSISLVYLAHELSRRPVMQKRLRDELLSLTIPLTSASAPDIPDARALDSLPFLQAAIMETLRLHAAAPAPQPRVSPADAVLGPPGQQYSYIPGGMRVACQAWSLHRNEAVFPDAGTWLPERWLDARGGLLSAESAGDDCERYREMMRWFWGFGSGGRMCIGSHLAMYQMKFIVAAIWSNYETTVVDDEGMEHVDNFIAHPKSRNPLKLAFKPV